MCWKWLFSCWEDEARVLYNYNQRSLCVNDQAFETKTFYYICDQISSNTKRESLIWHRICVILYTRSVSIAKDCESILKVYI